MRRVVAISGSLRELSSTTALVRAAAHVGRDEGLDTVVYEELRALPAFDPDVADDDAPAIVARLRTTLRECDAVLVCSPEYAHGVPGVLKNALDWLVGSGELYGKPVAVLNASPRARHAHASLVETLTVMGARVVADALGEPLVGKSLAVESLARDEEVAPVLRRVMVALSRPEADAP